MSAIEGTSSNSFAKAREQFEKHFAEGLEVGASFAVVKDGEVVVDLWGGHADAAKTKPWEHDTLINVWSTTKGLTATCCALLVERGKLDYAKPVATYWPEFAAGGKGEVTVAQMLSHQAGLSGLREPTTVEDVCEATTVADRLAAQEPLWEPGTANGYHAFTYGALAGELVRRITGKTLGTFWREEIAEPWGIDFFIGLPESEEPRVAEIIPAPELQPLVPDPKDDVRFLTFTNPGIGQGAPNDRAWRAAEIPAANGHGTAAALARFYGALAQGGELDGKKLLSRETIDAMRTQQVPERPDLILELPAQWACGVAVNMFALVGGNPGGFGHAGWGGSFGYADPEAGLAIAYTMNRMSGDVVGDMRAFELADAVYASL